jgi:hypothetical protein
MQEAGALGERDKKRLGDDPQKSPPPEFRRRASYYRVLFSDLRESRH